MTMGDQQITDVTEGSELLDEARLASKLGVSRSTLQTWRDTSKGPRFIKVGRLIRYRLADIAAYRRAQTRGNVSVVSGTRLWSES